MADIAKDYEYMKNGMNIRDIFETIQDSPGYIGYSFTNYPKDYCKPTCIVERFERNEYGQSHQNIANRLKIALSFHLAETQSGTDQCTHPYESEDNPCPDRFACRTHGDKGKRRVTASDMPVDGCVVELTCNFLGPLS